LYSKYPATEMKSCSLETWKQNYMVCPDFFAAGDTMKRNRIIFFF
jgi:hypothetical protein